uniref:Uncharacterized protein n=1 Tax=Arundo donax TaxID=35708 RepID=A0A0A9BQM5_ARUDO
MSNDTSLTNKSGSEVQGCL